MTREIPLPNSWLQQVGFKLGNPFSTREAAAESESALVRYFVPHPSFDEILGSAVHPRSSFLVAKRGCGKTTSRRVIEWHCLSGRMDGPVLAVPYTEFSLPLRNADEEGRVPASEHISAILRQALPMLMDALARQPTTTERFIGGLLTELASYLRQYTTLLTERGMDKWLQKKNLLSREVNTAVLLQGKTSKEQPLFRFLSALLAASEVHWDTETQVPVKQLAGFVDLVRLAGFKAYYVLIDRIDEREPMASDPVQAAALLELLVTNLPIIELENTAFKFFVTPEVMTALQQSSGIRLDRLLVRDISWREKDLQYLLDRRVEVFTEGFLPSLDAVSQSSNLVSRIVSKAKGSPRSLLRLAEWLLYWHYESVGNSQTLLLTDADLKRAEQSFEHEQQVVTAISNPTPTSLWIDKKRQVWREGECLGHLSPLLHALFVYLFEQENQMCTMTDIAEAVYGDSFKSDETIRKLAIRLRDKLEPDPSQPRYLIKVPGGYILKV